MSCEAHLDFCLYKAHTPSLLLLFPIISGFLRTTQTAGDRLFSGSFSFILLFATITTNLLFSSSLSTSYHSLLQQSSRLPDSTRSSPLTCGFSLVQILGGGSPFPSSRFGFCFGVQFRHKSRHSSSHSMPIIVCDFRCVWCREIWGNLWRSDFLDLGVI